MSIIITNKDCTLYEANAFYTVVDQYVSPANLTSATLSIFARKNIPVVPSASGNFKWCVLSLYNSGQKITRSVNVQFQKSYTSTMVTGVPWIITTVGMNFVEWQKIMFTTTGTLLTWIVADTEYFVRNPNIWTWTYNISLTIAWALITFSATQSWVHTAHATLAEQTKLPVDIFWYNATTPDNSMGAYIINFNWFDTTPAITAWWAYRLTVFAWGAGVWVWYAWAWKNITLLNFVAYTDTLTTFVSWDTPIFAHYCEMDWSATFTGILWAWDTADSISAIVCSNAVEANLWPDDAAFFRCTSPAEPYTLSNWWGFLFWTHGWIRIWTQASPVPYANQFTIQHTIATVWTTHWCFRMVWRLAPNTYAYCWKSNFALYWETPILDVWETAARIFPWDVSFKTTQDMTTNWAVGDNLYIWDQEVVAMWTITTIPIKYIWYQSITPIMTAANIPSPFVVTSSANFTSLYAWKCFNNNYWQNDQFLGILPGAVWLKLDMWIAHMPLVYSVCTTDAWYIGSPMTEWTLQASNDDATWTVMDTQTGITWTNYVYKYFTITSPASYRYWKIVPTANTGSTTRISINKIRFFETAPDNTSIIIDQYFTPYYRKKWWVILNKTTKWRGIVHNGYAPVLSTQKIGQLANLNIEWVVFNNTAFTISYAQWPTITDPVTFMKKWTIKNIKHFSTSYAITNFLFNYPKITQLWMDIENVYTAYASLFASFDSIKTSTVTSWTLTMNNIYVAGTPSSSGLMLWAYKTKIVATNLRLSNANTVNTINFWWYVGSYIDGLYAYWCSWAINTGTLTMQSSWWCAVRNVVMEACGNGIYFNGTILDTVMENIDLSGAADPDGSFTTNTTTHSIVQWTYADIVFKNCIGMNKFYWPKYDALVNWSNFRFVNYNWTTNNDFVNTPYGTFYRTWDGLADTTVHTAWVGKFAIKFENDTYGNPLARPIKVPIGDIQNKTMTVAVRCKINSSKYYAWTTNMPRLTISCDDDTATAYAEAALTTDRQLLFVPITPTTTFGEIKATLTTDSNAWDRGYCTCSASSPAIITQANHWLVDGDRISFTTDDTIPTGILITNNYFVKYINANTFNISLVPWWINVNTTWTWIWNLSLRAYKDTDVYFDDVSVFYPPWSSLNLWGLDLRSAGYPIVPPIATSLNASDVWAFPQWDMTVTNSAWVALIDTMDSAELASIK